MSRGLQFSDEEIIKALEITHGGLYLAAERVSGNRGQRCTVKTIQRRIKNSSAVREVYEKYSGRRVDLAELALDHALSLEQPWAVLFTLRTQGKDRGYVERQEMSGPDGGPVQMQVIGLGFDTDKI